jgi:predicted transcriptional regulator
MIQPKPYAYARKTVVECGMDDSLRDVAGLFQSRNVGSVVVKDNKGGYAGMLTDSIIFDAISEGREVAKMRVSDFKLMPFVKAGKDADFGEVMDLFKQHGVSRIAMTDDSGLIVGIIKKSNIDRFSSFSMASTISSLKR